MNPSQDDKETLRFARRTLAPERYSAAA